MMAAARITGRTNTWRGVLVCVLAMSAAGVAQAQVGNRLQLEPVDPDHGDVGPLRVSTRSMPVDMRSPSGFDRVFRVPGSTGGVGAMDVPEDRFARVSGGIAAVFPRSDYVDGKKGKYALVPAGTVYYIGGINELQREVDAKAAMRPAVRPGTFSSSASTAAPGEASTRVGRANPGQVDVGYLDLRVPDANSPEAQREREQERARLRPDAAAPPANVLADDQYRRARMRQLLLAAGGSD